jgi:DNA-binding NtrC family response regulator
MRILVVDDHVELLAEIEQFLALSGHQVSAARSAEEAMRIVESNREYEVVVTDISMPGMNGIEMWDKMTVLLPRTKVIFISSTNNSFLQRYLPGAFLPKPFKLEDLHDCVVRVQTAAA